MDSKETMNLGNLAGNAIPQVFDRTLDQVMRNIADINTPAEQKRQIVLKITFKPAESRDLGEVSFTCEAKLASIKPAKGNFFIAKRGIGPTADIRAYARDPKQAALFAEEPAPERPV